jgi:hypothetical protein
MKVDFDNVRLSACNNMNLLIEFLNGKLYDETIEEFNINDGIILNGLFPKSFEEIVTNLRNELVIIGCVSSENGEIADISDKVNIAHFNSYKDD